MAKFCFKCGTPLDPVSGLCPNCSPQQHRNIQKKSPIFPTIAIIVVIILFLAAIAAGALYALNYFDIVDVPFPESLTHQTSEESAPEEHEPIKPDWFDAEEDDDFTTPPEPTPETIPETAPEADPADAAYREVVAICKDMEQAEAYKDMLPYLEQCSTENPDDSRYAQLLEHYRQKFVTHIVTNATEYVQEGDYKKAGLLIQNAQQIYNCTTFQELLTEYCKQLVAPLSSMPLLEDSNHPDTTEDVYPGTWMDVHGEKHFDSIRFWVINKRNYSNTEYAVYSIGSQYEVLYGNVVCASGSDSNSWAWIEIYLDGTLAYTSSLVSDTSQAESFFLNVSGVQEVMIKCCTDSPNFNYCLVDAILSEI